MGKTSISNMLKLISIPVYNSDEVVAEILKKNNLVKNKINSVWPGVLIKKKNIINKKKLRRIIFSNIKDKKKLEKIIHPLLQKEKDIFIMNNIKRKILAFEIPLLYETKQQKNYDYIFLATCKYSTQRDRVLKRKGMSEEIFDKINKTQIKTEDKIKMKPIVINTDSIKLLTFLNVMINILFIILKK